ncbi:unnamed protein product [Litomosoides sigmodontis]|uniref:WAP domain-containing protein n=1 Tax=Litomosoides sigmodontis TaxID=42156 RepID=A0A3P6TJK6_LITSI|nr:unnamed protein product [Litomosoides sigmodontis]
MLSVALLLLSVIATIASSDDVESVVREVTTTKDGATWCPVPVVGTQCPASSILHYYKCCDVGHCGVGGGCSNDACILRTFNPTLPILPSLITIVEKIDRNFMFRTLIHLQNKISQRIHLLVLNTSEMTTAVNKDEGIVSSMTYSISPSIAEQLLLLPDDSACSTPSTSSISSALSFTTNNHSDGNDEPPFIIPTETGIPKFEENTNNDEAAISSVYACETISETINSDNIGMSKWKDDSKSAYSLFESEYDINTTNRHKFPDWTWTNHSESNSCSEASKSQTHASSSFYHLLDMNAEPISSISVDNVAQKLHIPSQYQLEELQNFAPYVDVTYAERTPTVPYLPHILTRSEYIFDEDGNNSY